MLILPITRKSYTTEVRMAIDKVRTYPQVTTLAITCDKDSENIMTITFFHRIQLKTVLS